MNIQKKLYLVLTTIGIAIMALHFTVVTQTSKYPI